METECIVRPTTIAQAKREIAKKTGAPEKIIEIEIDHATQEYTQYSLVNRIEVHDAAKNKNRVADYYRFESRKLEE